jgi:plasmid stabilization system protein ParE
MPEAINSYIKNIRYLQNNWTEKEIAKFELACDKKLKNISMHPHLGTSRANKHPNIRYTLIHKRVALIYRFKPKLNEIELLQFWNTSQNPKKLKLRK